MLEGVFRNVSCDLGYVSSNGAIACDFPCGQPELTMHVARRASLRGHERREDNGALSPQAACPGDCTLNPARVRSGRRFSSEMGSNTASHTPDVVFFALSVRPPAIFE